MTAGINVYSPSVNNGKKRFNTNFSSSASSAPIVSNSRHENTWISVLKAISHISSDNESFIIREGDTVKTMDRSVGKSVFKITGFIPANNYIKIPSPLMNTNTWHKIGSNLPLMYLAIKPMAPAKDASPAIFVIHIELVLEENFVFRLSISNIFKKIKVTSNSVLIPYHVSSVLKWNMVVVDLPGLSMLYGKRAFRHLKSIQICSNLLFKDVYLGNNLFDRRHLPRDAAFPAFKEGQWDDHYDWMVLTSEGKDSQEAYFHKDRLASSPRKSISSYVPASSTNSKTTNAINLASLSPTKAGVAKYMESKAAIETASLTKNEKIIISEPMIELTRINGAFFQTTRSPAVISSNSDVIYPVQNVLVRMAKGPGDKQTLLFGHSNTIIDVAVASNGEIFASCQKNPSLIRLWDAGTSSCHCIMEGPVEPRILLFSVDSEHLLVIGREYQNRHLMLFWNVSKSLTSGRATLVNQNIVDAALECVAWSPFSSDKFVTGGDNFCKVWRFQPNELLRSFSVKFPTGVRPFIVTAAFMAYKTHPFLFLGSKTGEIYRVNSNSLVTEDTIIVGQNPITFIMSLSRNKIMLSDKSGEVKVYEDEIKPEKKVFAYTLEKDFAKSACSFTSIDQQGNLVDNPILATANGCIYKLDLSGNSDSENIQWTRSSSISTVAHHQSESYFAVHYNDGSLAIFNSYLYEIKTSTETESFGNVTCMTFYPLPHLKVLFLGHSDGQIVCRDYSSFEVLARVNAHYGPVKDLLISEDGNMLYSVGSTDTRIVKIDMEICDVDGHNCLKGLHVTRMAHGDWQGTFQNTTIVAPQKGSLDAKMLYLVATQTKIPEKLVVLNAETLEIVKRVEVGCSFIGSEIVYMGQSDYHGGNILIIGKRGNVWLIDPLSWRLSKQSGSFASILFPKVKSVCDFEICNISVADAFFFYSYFRDGVYVPSVEVMAFQSGFQSHSKRQTYNTLHDTIVKSFLDRMEMKLTIFLQGGISCVWEVKGELDESGFLEELKNGDQQALVSKDHDGQSSDSLVGRSLKDLKKSSNAKNVSSYKLQEMTLSTLEISLKSSLSANQFVSTQNDRKPLPETLYLPLQNDAVYGLDRDLGYSGGIFKSATWMVSNGYLAYISGSRLILDDMSNHVQHILLHLDEPSTRLSAFAVQSSEKYLVTASLPVERTEHSRISLWKISDRTCERSFYHNDSVVQSLKFSPDDRLLISVGNYTNPNIKIWDPFHGNMLANVDVSHPINDVAWDPFAENEFITVGESQITFWLLHQVADAEGGYSLKNQVAKIPEALFSETNPTLRFHAVAYKPPPSSLLFTSSQKGTISLWDSRDNSCLFSFTADDHEIYSIYCLGHQLITGSAAGRIRIWKLAPWLDSHNNAADMSELQSGGEIEAEVKLVREFQVDPCYITSLKFNTTGSLGVVGTSGGSLWLLKQDGEIVQPMLSGITPNKDGSVSKISSISSSSTCEWLCGVAQNGEICLWNSKSFEALNVRPEKHLNERPNKYIATKVAIGCGRDKEASVYVAVGYDDGFISVFHVSQLRHCCTFQSHDSAITALSFAFNQGDSAYVISGDSNGLVYVSLAKSGLTVRVIRDHAGAEITQISEKLEDNSSTNDYLGDGSGANSNSSLAASWEQQSKAILASKKTLLLLTSKDLRASLWTIDWKADEYSMIDWMTFPVTKNSDEIETDGFLRENVSFSGIFHGSNRDEILFKGPFENPSIMIYNIRTRKKVRMVKVLRWPSVLAAIPGQDLVALGSNRGLLTIVDLESGSFQDYLGCVNTSNITDVQSVGPNKLAIASDSGEVLIFKSSSTK